jgi:hypothetical protein
MWLGHQTPHLRILGTKDERTPAWPEFEVMTELSPSQMHYTQFVCNLNINDLWYKYVPSRVTLRVFAF